MGLFDKFGVGGGTVAVNVQQTSYAAGSTVHGTITFTGGKRAQKVTALLVWLTRGTGTEINLVKGESQTKDGGSAAIGAKLTVSGELAVKPGETVSFPFELAIPTAVMSSRSIEVNGQPGPVMQMYRVWGTADIPGEIDKHGHSAEFEISGGSQLEITTK